MINGDAYSRSHYITYAVGSLVGLKGAGSAVKITGKLGKTGAAKVDKVLEAEEKAAAKHVKTRINSLSKSKYEPALVGMAQDIESTHNVKNTPLLKKVIEEEKESVLYKSENGSSKSIKLFGSEGVRVSSKTVWKEKESKAHIDVENPNPGQRAGQIHYQDSNNTKYLFDPKKGSFIDLNGNIAPKKVNALLKNKEFVKKLNVGLKKYLGEEEYNPKKK